MHFPAVPCVGHFSGAEGVHAWPVTGSRYPARAMYRRRYPARAIYRGEVPCVGHLPEVGTPRGRVHSSAIFTGAEGIPDRVHTSAIYRKVYPYRRVPASAIYRKVDPDRRVHALAIYRGEVPCVGHLPGEVPCIGHVIRAPARTGPSS